MMAASEVVLGSITGLLASLFYGVSVVIYRTQKDHIRPADIGSIKMWVALGFMTFIILLPIGIAPFRIPLYAAFFLIASVTLSPVLGDILYLSAQERIGVAYAFPIAGTYPILTYILALFFLDESLSVVRLAGTGLAVLGVITISREQSSHSTGPFSIDRKGIGLALSTALLYAFGTIFLQAGLTEVDPINGNFFRVLVGSVEFLPLFFLARLSGIPAPSKRSSKIVSLAGLFGMAFGSLLFVSTVKFIGAAMTSVLGSMSPLFAVPISVVLLNERLTSKGGLGILAAVLGVVLVVIAY